MSALDDLLAPLGAESFFATCWEQKPVHLPGDPSRGATLCSHARLLDALTQGNEPPEGLLAFPSYLEPDLSLAELLADPARLDAYLEAGHPLVWNRARGIFPEVDAFASCLAVSFGAQVWPNVYSTGTAGTPFDAHFDAHEVISVHCEGQKRWWLSELRVDRPLDVAEMEPALAHVLVSRRDEALARTLLEVTSGPGDVLYIPRGQFHNASAVGGRSLHVTFGIRLPSGFDALRLLAGEALADAGLREYLLPSALDPEGSAGAAEVLAITERLRAQITPEGVGAALASIRARFRATSG